jgi:phosphoglucosamine mutase
VELFGTDGVRGEAPAELSPELALAIGAAAASARGSAPTFVIGRDPRVSGPMLEAAAVAGITAAGGRARLLGMLPTPAVAALVPMLGADAGLVISASHNPPRYNGLKLLDRQGRKWDPADEEAVARRVASGFVPKADWAHVGSVETIADGGRPYRDALVERFAGKLTPARVVVDLGHGAAVATVPDVLRRLGFEVVVLHGEPDGLSINQGVGATHPAVVAAAVLREGAVAGFSFDGDADRVMAADERGQVVDGDGILYVLGKGLKAAGRLPGCVVVGTVMANLGLERALRAEGVGLIRTPVGDRWVARAMAEQGATLGGEQSGHVILSEWAVTGDGLLTALALLAEMHRTGGTLSELAAGVERFPQVLKNVELPAPGYDWAAIAGFQAEMARCRTALGNDGRLVVRASGTEPLLRIMIEGRDAAVVDEWVDRLTAVVRHALVSG